MTPLFDRAVLNKKRARANQNDHFLLQWVCDQFTDRSDLIKRDFENKADFTPFNDPFDNSETLSDTGPYDLITSALHMHTINDLPGALIQLKRALVPDGLFLGAVFGGDTLFELRESMAKVEIETSGGISPRIHPMTTRQDIGALMQRAGFALPVVDSERVTVTYKSFKSLISDLRAMGETNCLITRNKAAMTRVFWQQVEAVYKKNYSEGETLLATFDIIFMLGWSPDKSQPQPLKRGSAEISLRDVL